MKSELRDLISVCQDAIESEIKRYFSDRSAYTFDKNSTISVSFSGQSGKAKAGANYIENGRVVAELSIVLKYPKIIIKV